MYKNHPKPLQMGSRPIAPGIPNPACPVCLDAKIVLDNTQELHRRLRRLRLSTQRCFTCPEKAECRAIRRLVLALDTALRELNHEWGLGHE